MPQLVVIFTYALLSMAMAVALPTFIPVVTAWEGLLSGFVIFLGAGLAHANAQRRIASTTQARHLLLLKKAYDKTKLDLLEMRNDMLHLRDMMLSQEENDRAKSREAVSQAPKAAPASAKKTKAKKTSTGQPPHSAATAAAIAAVTGGAKTSNAIPSFLTDDESAADKFPDNSIDEEGTDAESLASGILEALGQGGATPSQSLGLNTPHQESIDQDDYEDEWDGESDEEEMLQEETEAERRTSMAKEVEVLQSLVDKLYTDGLPEQVRGRVEDLDLKSTSLSANIKPHVELDEAMLPIVREALESKRLDAHLQPIHTLPQRKRRFFEAFGRLRSKDGELLIPERIQLLMDEDGLNPTADTLLLYRCAQILKQNGGLEFDRAIFCNVSPSTLSDVSFLRDFSEYMEKRRTLARSLVLELDYATVDPLLDDLREPMGRLAGIGLRFALDNVKVDHLDSMMLGRSHVSFVKMDSPSLLALTNRNGKSRFETLLTRLEKEDIQVIGENIASERMLMEIMDLGIEYGQGMLFGEPKPVKDPSSGLHII